MWAVHRASTARARHQEMRPTCTAKWRVDAAMCCAPSSTAGRTSPPGPLPHRNRPRARPAQSQQPRCWRKKMPQMHEQF